MRGEWAGAPLTPNPSPRGRGGTPPNRSVRKSGCSSTRRGPPARPKGRSSSIELWPSGAAAIARALLGPTPDDVGLFIIPVSHAFGLEVLLATLAAGSLAVLVDAAFSLKALVEAVAASA